LRFGRPRDVMWPGNNGVTLSVYERYRYPLHSRDDHPAQHMAVAQRHRPFQRALV
jgi:hypothetical protein